MSRVTLCAFALLASAACLAQDDAVVVTAVRDPVKKSYRKMLDGAELFEARRAMYQQAGSELHAMFHPLWLYPPDYVNAHDAEIDEERRKAVAGAPPVEVSVGRIEAIMGFDRRKDLHRIKAPTLIVAADNDYITPAYHAQALARAIPGSKLVVMNGGGHSLSKTRPEEFNRIVFEFLGG